MANLNVVRYLEDSAGVELNAVTKTATFNSETLPASDFDTIGLIIDANSVTGTSPSFVFKAQVSIDGGTTWLDTYPAEHNAGAQAQIAAITAASEIGEFWPDWTSAGSSMRIRFVCTVTGTSPSAALTVWLVRKNVTSG